MKTAFMGLGAMGSRMAKHLVAAGHDVALFNRSREPAVRLAEAGGRVASSPREAVEDAEIVVSMVTDDAASRAIWLDPGSGAVHGLKSGAVVVESSTVTPAFIDELASAVSSRGGHLLDAPVAGTLPQAENKQLVYFVGGDERALEQAKPVLSQMGATIHHVGRVGNGARFKLAVNGLFATQVAVLGELLGYLARSDIAPADAMEVLGALAVCSPAAKGTGALIAAGKHAPLFPIDLVEKDMRYAVQSAAALNAATPVLTAVHRTYANAQAQGHGADNITGVAKQFLD